MSGHPKVEDARELGRRGDLRRCIVLFELEDGRIGYASYRETRELCDDTRELADSPYDEMERLMVLTGRAE